MFFTCLIRNCIWLSIYVGLKLKLLSLASMPYETVWSSGYKHGLQNQTV